MYGANEDQRGVRAQPCSRHLEGRWETTRALSRLEDGLGCNEIGSGWDAR